MSTGVVAMLQARMGSKRLPGKVLKPIGAKPMIEQIIARVRRSKICDELFVLTTSSPDDDSLAHLCEELGVKTIRGSQEDVLSRYVTALDHTEAGVIVRLTGDNPFVDGSLVDYLLAAFLGRRRRADYANNIENSGFPYGLSAEIICRSALLDADEHGFTREDREHVTHYVRTRPDHYRLQTICAPGNFNVESLTIDTKEQYENVSALFQRMDSRDPNFTFYDLIDDHTGNGRKK